MLTDERTRAGEHAGDAATLGCSFLFDVRDLRTYFRRRRAW